MELRRRRVGPQDAPDEMVSLTEAVGSLAAALEQPPRAMRGGREVSWQAKLARRVKFCLLLAATGALFAVLFFIVLFGSFVAFDAVGLRVTVLAVRAFVPLDTAPPAAAGAAGPSPTVADTFGELLDLAFARLDALEVRGERFGVHYGFSRPAMKKYGSHQWLWDSGFHQMINAHRDLARSVEDLYSLLSAQDSATGFIPEMVYWHDDPGQHGIPRAMFGYSKSSRTDLTQMPVIGLAVEAIDARLAAAVTGAINVSTEAHRAALRARAAFLCNTLPRVQRYLEWWLQYRDPDGDGLVSIIHPWESGLDASPLYDDAHTLSRIRRRRGVDVEPAEGETTWGADGRSARPEPRELYPEFIILLYRYRHRAHWDALSILDPIAAQTRCADSSRERAAVDDGRATAWAVNQSPLHRTRRAALAKAAAEGTYVAPRLVASVASASIGIGVFDVEDIGVNAVLAASLQAVSRMYRELADVLHALESTRRHDGMSQRDKDAIPFWWDDGDAAASGSFSGARDINTRIMRRRQGWCCWAPDAHIQPSRPDHYATLEARAVRAMRQADRLSAVLLAKAWRDDRGHFVSFCHDYAPGRSATGDDCMREHELRRETIQSLFPLLAPHMPEKVVLAMLGAVEDTNRFGALSPMQTIPTVSRREKDVFEEHESPLMWRGPSWPTTNWLVARGLANTARNTDYSLSTRRYAARLHAGLVDRWIAMHRQFGFHEYHSPTTGKGMGQQGLGMSHAIVDVLLAAFDGQRDTSHEENGLALLSPRAMSWIRESAAVVDAMRKKRTADVSAVYPGAPGSDGTQKSLLQRLLFNPPPAAEGLDAIQSRRRALIPQHPHDDGVFRFKPQPAPSAADAYAAASAQGEDDDDENGDAELLSELSMLAAADDWRDVPLLQFSCCIMG